MIRLERTDYGPYVLFNLQFIDREQGLGYSPMRLDQEDKVSKKFNDPSNDSENILTPRMNFLQVLPMRTDLGLGTMLFGDWVWKHESTNTLRKNFLATYLRDIMRMGRGLKDLKSLMILKHRV